MIKYALSIVFRQKLRTLLTSLGVTIAVVLLSFIIFGMSDIKELFVNEFSSRFNPTEVFVMKANPMEMMSFTGGESETTDDVQKEPVILSQEVIDELDKSDLTSEVSANIMITTLEVKLDAEGSAYSPAFIMGWDVSKDDDFFVESWGDQLTLKEGEAFVSKMLVDYYRMTPEEIIGKDIILSPSASSFFASKSKSLLDKSYTYEVVGVVDPGQDRSDVVLPLSEGVAISVDLGGFVDSKEFLDNVGYDNVFIDASNEDNVVKVVDLIETKYNLSALTSDDFLEFINIIIDGLTLFLIIFGLISGIVASIGIINTMVMSIYEQTREIGINKAIGASNKQVFIIFLIQSAVIGLLGGTLGLGIVFVAMKLSDPTIVRLLADAGFTVETFFSFDLIIALYITLGSIVVGILAGLYPAMKAARLDPVKALRYE